MSSQKEIIENLKKINTSLAATIADVEKGQVTVFYKESIKLAALGIFENAQLLLVDVKPETIKSEVVKPAPEVKIIKQEVIEQPVVVKAPEPEKEVPKPEPVIIQQVLEPIETPLEKIETPEVKKVIEPTPPPPPVEPKKAEVKEVKKTIVSKPPVVEETEEDTSLNAKLAKYQHPVNLADKMKDTPIKELVKAISISKKFEFINELFGGNAEMYKTCIQKIESGNSYIEAVQYLETEVAAQNNWSYNEPLAGEFFSLVKRRFL